MKKFFKPDYVLRLVPLLWIAFVLVIPYLFVFKISFSDALYQAPPYRDLISRQGEHVYAVILSLKNYVMVFSDEIYIRSFLNSIGLAAVAAGCTFVLGFPFAFALTQSDRLMRPILLLMVMLPFWISFLIRAYAWMGIISDKGFLNQFLISLGCEPLQILDTPLAVVFGMTYVYLPFMVLPLYSALEKLDLKLVEAAYDLGARPLTVLTRVVIPQAKKGIMGGAFLVFIPAVGEFVIPELLGGSKTLMIGKVLWYEFFQNHDWPVASAIAMVLLLVLIGPIIWFQKLQLDRD